MKSKKTAIAASLTLLIPLTAIFCTVQEKGGNPWEVVGYGIIGAIAVAAFNPLSMLFFIGLLIAIPADIETKTWAGSTAVVLCAFGAAALYFGTFLYLMTAIDR